VTRFDPRSDRWTDGGDTRPIGVAAVREVLDSEAPEGIKNVRRGTGDDGAAFVDRIDSEAEGSVDPDHVRPGGEFPDSEVTMWRATREMVEREVERRGLENTE